MCLEADESEKDGGETASETEARLKQRVRDLELELAQVKLAHVQAQCSNQVIQTSLLYYCMRRRKTVHTEM